MPRRGRSMSFGTTECVSSARSISGSDGRPAKIEPKIDTGDDRLDVLRDAPTFCETQTPENALAT